MARLPLLIAFACAVLSFCSASKVNVTIDDTSGDERTGRAVQFNGFWKAHNSETTCPGCSRDPLLNETRGSSWHSCDSDNAFQSGMDAATMSFSFNGTALWVFFILLNHPDAPRVTNVSFSLDSGQSQQYMNDTYNGADGYIYNVPVFASGKISMGEHTLVMTNTGTKDRESVAIFDYVIYEIDDAEDSSTQRDSGSITTTSTPSPIRTTAPVQVDHKPVGIIAGCTMAGVAILCIGIAIAAFHRRRMRRTAVRLNESSNEPRPVFFSASESVQAPPPYTDSLSKSTGEDRNSKRARRPG